MSLFKKGPKSLTQGVAKDGGALKKPEIFWSEAKIIRQRNTFRAFLPIMQLFCEKTRDYSREEILFSKFFQKFAKEYDLSNREEGFKPKSAMEDEEKKKNEQYRQIYDDIGSGLVKMGVKRRNLGKAVEKSLKGNVDFILREEPTLNKTLAEYETCLDTYNKWHRVVYKMDKDLQKAETKTKAVSGMKEKKKKQKAEVKKMKSLKEKEEAFDEVKKLAVYVEQKADDEVIYQLKLGEDSMLLSLLEVIQEYRKFHQQTAKTFEEIERKIHAMKIKKDGIVRVPKVVIDTPRDVFDFSTGKKIVGVSLDVIMERQHEKGPIPQVYILMIKIIEKNLDVEGIFRKAGDKETRQYLLRHVDSGKMEFLGNVKSEKQVHIVCCALKEMVRLLPDSFCPWSKFEKFSEISNKKKKRVFIQKNLKTLSPASQQLFYYLFQLCYNVEKRKKVNLMNEEALSRIWGVNMFRHELLRTKDPSQLVAMNDMMEKMNAVFAFTLKNFSSIYSKSPPKPKYKKVKKVETTEKDIKKIRNKYMKKKVERKNLETNTTTRGESSSNMPKDLTPIGVTPGGPSETVVEGSMYDVTVNYIDPFEQVTALASIDSDESKFVATGNVKGFVKIYKVTNDGIISNPVFTLKHQEDSPIVLIKALRDSKMILTSCESKTVKIWELEEQNEDGKLIKTLTDPRFLEPVDIVLETSKKNMLILCAGTVLIGYDRVEFTKKIEFQQVHTRKISQLFDNSQSGNIYTVSRDEGLMIEWKHENPAPKFVYNTIKNERITVSVPCFFGKKETVISCLASGKYVNWATKRRRTILDTYKGSCIERALLLNRKRDLYVMVFGSKSDEVKNVVATVVSSVGVLIEHEIRERVVGVKKVNRNSYFYWDEVGNIGIFDTKKKTAEYKSKGRLLNVVHVGEHIISCSENGRVIFWTGDPKIDDTIPSAVEDEGKQEETSVTETEEATEATEIPKVTSTEQQKIVIDMNGVGFWGGGDKKNVSGNIPVKRKISMD